MNDHNEPQEGAMQVDFSFWKENLRTCGNIIYVLKRRQNLFKTEALNENMNYYFSTESKLSSGITTSLKA